MLITPTTNSHQYNENEVYFAIADATKQVVLNITAKLIEAHPQKLTFAQIADKHTVTTLDDDINEADEKVRRVYNKLMAASKVTIDLVSSNPIGVTLEMIRLQKHDDDAPRKFLGSFVFPEAKRLCERLQTEQPGAVDDAKIWR